MKKNLLYGMVILSVMMVGLSFTSCSKDDGNPLVGTWSCNNHYYGGSSGRGTDTYIFKSNGTYEWSCTGDWWDNVSGNYSYDVENGILSINRNATEVYYIISITESSFTMMDEVGDYYTYYRK